MTKGYSISIKLYAPDSRKLEHQVVELGMRFGETEAKYIFNGIVRRLTGDFGDGVDTWLEDYLSGGREL